jgi:multidrug resistance efflux pump
MLRSRFRVVALTATVAVAGALSIALWPTSAQEPAPAGKDAKLKKLLQERVAATRELEQTTAQMVARGQKAFGDSLETTRLIYEAALDASESDNDRLKLWEKFLAAAKENERIAVMLHEAGQSPITLALKAKAERLRVEIAMERARLKKQAPGGEAPGTTKIEQPAKAGTNQSLTVRASIKPFETVAIFARVPGYVEKWTVDIGDRVKRGDVLAVLDVPELNVQVLHDRAATEEARARVQEALAAVRGSEADLETARQRVMKAEAEAQRAAASVVLHEQQWKRAKLLFDQKVTDESMLAESKVQFDGAKIGVASAQAAIAVAKAEAAGGAARIERAKAGVSVAEEGVKVAQANLKRSEVNLASATLTAPFDGVIARRNCNQGDFVPGGSNSPQQGLYTVQRLDIMRVIVPVPEREAPLVHAGSRAEIVIDAFPGTKIACKVSRVSLNVDARTNSMIAAIDIPNPTGRIYAGMTCSATILFDKSRE